MWLIADGLWRLRRFSRIEAGVLTWHTYEFMRTRLEQKSGAAAQACAERSLSAKQAAIDDLQANLDYAAIAFMADVNGPNTLGNLSRYETTLANRTMKYMADLHKLQSNQVSTSS